MAFCEECGNQLKENAKFCAKCGSRTDTQGIEDTVPVGENVSAQQDIAQVGGSVVRQNKITNINKDYTIILKDFDFDQKIAVINIVREVTGLGLKEAKDLVESVPKPIITLSTYKEALNIKKQFEDVDAIIKIRSNTGTQQTQ